MRYQIVTPDLLDKVETLEREEQAQWLFLFESPEFKGRWSIESPWPDFFWDFQDLIGHYRTISPAKLDEFLKLAEELGYHVAFSEPPEAILSAFEHLDDLPPISLRSELENTRNGLLPWQIQGFNKLIKDESLPGGLAVWDTGPQPMDTPVLTPTGWTTLDALKVGDRIIGSDGRPHAITGVFPQGVQEVFRLTFKDGSQAHSTGEHLWGFFDHVGNYYVRRLDEYMTSGLYHKRGDAKWFVDRVAPIEYDPVDLPVDPYLLGVLLGDTARNKFVPEHYKLGSVADRLALLQGLLDTDGSAEKESARFFSISRQLAQDVIDLARSLGGRAKLSWQAPRQNEIKGRMYDCQEGWKVSLSLPAGMEYFRLDRKKVERRPQIGLNSLRAIDPIGAQEVQCISVDAQDGRYVTQDFVLTHNTGKTGFIASAIEFYADKFDLAFIVVKKNNKADMQRKIRKLTGRESYVIGGSRERRDKIYAEIFSIIETYADSKAIVICNYEQFREDNGIFESLVTRRNCLFFWDEMPTRLSNRTTQVYKSVKDVLWKVYPPSNLDGAKPRPAWMRQWELTATPIENSPEGLFNCIRLMDPPLLGTVTEFQATHVVFKNPISMKPEKWGNLDLLEGKIEHMQHRVSQEDPEVAKMFPTIMPPDPVVMVDWDARDREIYDILSGKAVDIIEDTEFLENNNILPVIQVMQMLCDIPSMIVASAANREVWLALCEEDPSMIDAKKGSEIAARLLKATRKKPNDKSHTKFEALREIIQEKHPGEKVLVYMTWSGYGFKPMAAKMEEWGVSYVVYEGTEKERLAAKDWFRDSSGPTVFLSSDAGSDSIDLPEAAVGVNYNLPWTWTRKRQRQGRNNRVDSRLDVTWWYDLVMADSVEQRKQEIIATKKGYHTALFDGHALEEAVSAKLTREDFLYILKGD